MKRLYAALVLALIRPALQLDRRERSIVLLDSGVRLTRFEPAPKKAKSIFRFFRPDLKGGAKDAIDASLEDRL